MYNIYVTRFFRESQSSSERSNMADYSVKITITNESNKEGISSQTTVGEENAKKIWEAYLSIAGTIPFLNIEDIR